MVFLRKHKSLKDLWNQTVDSEDCWYHYLETETLLSTEPCNNETITKPLVSDSPTDINNPLVEANDDDEVNASIWGSISNMTNNVLGAGLVALASAVCQVPILISPYL